MNELEVLSKAIERRVMESLDGMHSWKGGMWLQRSWDALVYEESLVIMREMLRERRDFLRSKIEFLVKTK